MTFIFLISQTATGNVEAKVVCFYRRRDISNTLIMLADKHASKLGFFLGLIKKCFKSFIIHDVRKKPFPLPVGFCFLICLPFSLDGSNFFGRCLVLAFFFLGCIICFLISQNVEVEVFASRLQQTIRAVFCHLSFLMVV